MAERERRRRNRIRNLTPEDLMIMTKEAETAPLKLVRVQKDLWSKIRVPGTRHLILKSRQVGVSTVVQAYLFLTAIQRPARIGTLANEGSLTEKLRLMVDFFWQSLPETIQPKREIDNSNIVKYAQTGSTTFIGTAGNQNTGRGGTYTHVHGSEVAFWPNARQVVAGFIQGVPKTGVIVFESTPNGAQGWFYERCKEAQKYGGIWQLHFYPWWWEPTYFLPLDEGEKIDLEADEVALVNRESLSLEQIKWRRYKIEELGSEFFQEYPEDPDSCFLASGEGYFTITEDTFTAPLDSVYLQDHRYVAGLDFGQSHDFTVCHVLDETTGNQVDLLRINRMSWEEMRHRVVDICKKWSVKILVAETNSMGQVNIELLNDELSRSNAPTAIVPFTTTQESKKKIIQYLRYVIEHRQGRFLSHPAQTHEFRVFKSRQTANGNWSYGAEDPDHDDCVMAAAFAWEATNHEDPGFYFVRG